MVIQTSTFLALVGAIAAGGAGGYYASEKQLFAQPLVTAEPPKDVTGPLVVAIAAASSSAPAAAPLPACDDTSGTPGACPPPGFSAEEGGCGSFTTKRCGDFKQSLKPKVAEHAVECINALKAGERCDPMRVALCGHLSLMRACTEPEPASSSSTAPPPPGSVTATCQTIIQGCAGATLAPTPQDCRATLSGMTDLGKTNMVSCMKTHCADKGLLGCEGMIDVK